MIVVVVDQEADGAVVETSDGSGTVYSALISREFIEDNIGDTASSVDVNNWVLRNSESLAKAIINIHNGGVVRAPYNRLIPRESR